MSALLVNNATLIDFLGVATRPSSTTKKVAKRYCFHRGLYSWVHVPWFALPEAVYEPTGVVGVQLSPALHPWRTMGGPWRTQENKSMYYIVYWGYIGIMEKKMETTSWLRSPRVTGYIPGN